MITQPKRFIVVNPTAGGKNIKDKWDSEIYPYLLNNLPPFDFKFTRQPGDATTITRNALKSGYTLIISMGGDGTLNEVVNGFFNKNKPVNPDAILGFLPFGSGGDFIRTLNIPRNYKQAINILNKDGHKKIDVGKVTFLNSRQSPRHFLNIAEVGLGANIMQKVNKMNRKLPALYRYLSGTLKTFITHKNIPVVIQSKKTATQRPCVCPELCRRGPAALKTNLTNLIIANGKYFGRGMCPAPNAKLDDGLFEVVIIKELTLKTFLTKLPQMYSSKKNISDKYHSTFKTNSLEVKTQSKTDNLYCEVDGENCGQGSLLFEILPKAIKIKG